MIVKANCTQLENNDLFLNIANSDFQYLGVWTSAFRNIIVLYGVENEVWFMTFDKTEQKKEFEELHRSLKILWQSTPKGDQV